MGNDDPRAAWAYHNATKHSLQSVRSSRHYLDWENQPLPFKIYPQLEPVVLPQPLASSRVAALEAIAADGSDRTGSVVPALQALAEILYFSAGVIKRVRYPGGDMYFRAAACTGALYHVDLYLVCGELPGLAAGVYHFGPHDFTLRRLRAGDYRRVLSRASGDEPSVAAAPAIIACASTYWRNAWKYQARAYRHCFWDSGTILANLLAVAAAGEVPARIVLSFVDVEVSRLLALDSEREGALCLVALGKEPTLHAAAADVTPLSVETQALSPQEVDYPAIREMQEASSLATPEAAASWRARDRRFALEAADGPAGGEGRLFPLEPLARDQAPSDTIEQVIRRRGSTREFAREPISFAELSTMLDRATRGVPTDLSDAKAMLNHLYLIVNAVSGLPSGAYVYRPDRGALQLLKEGDFRRQAGHLGLGQDIPADASVDVFFLTDLRQAFERWGSRGYRATQLEAAVVGGKLYLAAYSQRLGASGLTFFDDDVSDFFSPHAAGKSVMFLIALGKSAKRK